MAKNVNTPASPVVSMTISQIVARTGMSKVYIHRALVKGWLKGTKSQMPNSKIEQWTVTSTDYEIWRQRVESHKTPHSGFAGNAKQIADVKSHLEGLDPEAKVALLRSLGIDVSVA